MRVPYDLPFELFAEIVSYAIQENPRPNDVLAVNSAFYDVGVAFLYTRLHFRSVHQLSLFVSSTSPLPVTPRHIELTLPGGTAAFTVFRNLEQVFRRCDNVTDKKTSAAGLSLPLALESLSLCLNSHSSNPYLHYVYKALRLVNPKRFVWLGPDPSHHFSTAIVPTATLFLFGAMSEWSNVEHITLTNISFPSNIPTIGDSTSEWTQEGRFFPPLPRLRTLYIGQATLFRPSAMARMLFAPEHEHLEQVRLVDTYKESIWGSRVRRKDVEKAALALQLDLSPEVIKERVKKLVKCEVKTERIMGGDRVEGVDAALE